MSIELSERIAFLKKIHLFYGLEDDALKDVAEELEEVPYSKDSVVVKQDAPADTFYIIYKGSVRIVRRQDGGEIQLARLVKYDYFGELALVSNRPRSATVTALEETTLLVLSRDDFKKLFREHPDLKNNLEVAVHSRQLARKLRFKWLRPEEVVYFLARKHWVALYPKIVAPLAFLVVPIFFGYAYFRFFSYPIVAAAALGSFFAAIIWFGWLVVDWRNDYYVVTDQRVVWLEKVVGIYDSRQESPLSMIVSVGVEVTQFGRFLDYGHVIVRTFVGRIDFRTVNHPKQAAKMVEEYWERTRRAAMATEKEAMKDAIRSRLGIPLPPKPQPASAQPATSLPKQSGAGLLKLLGANTLKLRYETGESVIYRKHWVVLILDSWAPLTGFFAMLGLFLSRVYQLWFVPAQSFVSFLTGIFTDVWALAFLGATVPFAGWFVYRIMDWSNDVFEVTAEQIIDIDRTPFGTETRNSAQLENILGTKYERKGLLGNLFNFGHVYITVGGNKLTFEDVRDPANVQSDIDRRRDARIVKKNQAIVAADRERMAEWLATYHDNAEEFRKAEEEKRNQKNGSA
jgi:hypothetical protein